MAVALEAVLLLADDFDELAVGLEADDAVDDVHAGAFELEGPGDVGVLVEARLDLDQRQHLLAGVGRVDQRVDDRRVGAGAVQRLLDGQHARVGGRLGEERLHRRGERIVGVVQQDVALADRGEDVLCAARFDFGDLTVRGRDERAVLEVRAVERLQFEQYGEVERRGQAVDLFRVDAELVGEQLGEERAGRVGDLQADRRSEAAAQQLLLHRVEQVLGVILFDVDVLVAGDAERARLLDDHAGEQGFEVRDDEVLHRDEPEALLAALLVGQVVDGDEAGHVAGDLHAGEVGFAGVRVLHQHREVQRVAGNVGERVRGVDGERREYGEDLLAVVARETFLLGGSEPVPAEQHDVLVSEGGEQLLGDVVRVLVLQAVRLLADGTQLLAGAQAAGRGDGDAGVDTALEAGDADHEEFIEVGGEDRGEIAAFQQRLVFVLGEFEDSLVELQPAEFSVEIAIRGQRLFAGLRLALVGFVCLGYVLGDLAAQDSL